VYTVTANRELPGIRYGARIIAVLLAWVLMPFVSSTAWAGVIKMQVTCGVDGTNVTVRMANTGDEPCQNVVAHLKFRDQEMRAEAIPDFPPGKEAVKEFSLEAKDLTGTYPIIAVVDFEDLNSYPFSSVTIQHIRVGRVSQGGLIATFEGQAELSTKAKLPLRIRNRYVEDVTATCRVITPNELFADDPEFEVKVPAKGEERVNLGIENFSGTPSSAYPVHVLLEYYRNREHFCAPATTMVSIVEPKATASKKFWLVLLAVIVVAGLVFLPQIRKALAQRKK